MKQLFVVSALLVSLVVAPSAALAVTNAPSGPERYMVQTSKAFWRGALGARRVQSDSFTADLSDLQLKIAKIAGLKMTPVKKFNILADTSVASVSLPMASVSPQVVPASATPWGVAYVRGKGTAAKLLLGAGVTVAVLDTGVDVEHPDLHDRVVACATFTDSSKGQVDGSCADGNGHGTHMAGIIAADGGPQGTGIVGLAPRAQLIAYKVCADNGSCYSDDIAAGIRAAVDVQAQIIVLGLGGEATSSFIDDAIAYAVAHEVLVVVAAGNDGPYADSMDWPARNPAVVSVGALASDGAVAEFSSRGANASSKPYRMESGDIELVAPGVNIESTFRNGDYAILSGSSMAAPHVAGLAALVWQATAKNPAQATRSLLHEMAHDISRVGDDEDSGWGVPRY